MLSASARPFIQASVPVLREHGVAISRRFYSDLFAAEPELRHVFNQGNQASGAQQGALAAALVAYAANIDHPEALKPVIERIAHKHASIGIKPSQYPTVARHLLGAIKQVLGAAASPELLSAWDEAYWLLAGALIAAESRLYERAAVDAGEFQELTVSAVTRESEDVVSFNLQTASGGCPGSFAPGQFASVEITLPDGLRQQRQYSLSDAPSRPHWRITVKRETVGSSTPAGRVSNHLHDHVKVGDVLRLGPAFGNFKPAAANGGAIVMLSAGVGITPMVSALNTLAEREAAVPVLFAHAARSGMHYTLRDEVERAHAQLPALESVTFYETDAGVDAEHVGQVIAGRMLLSSELLARYNGAEFFLCGPGAFMRAQWNALVASGVSPARVHREVFGPDLLDTLS